MPHALVNIFSLLSNVASKSGQAVIFGLILSVQTYMLYELQEHSHQAATNYPFSVIQYGFADVDTDEQKVELVRQWHHDKWGAQIGAIRTLCAETPNRLEELLSVDTTKTVCSIARR